MKRATVLAHEVVEFIPDDLKEGMLYISMGFATVAHRCCCGCGKEVVTPLNPTDWKLIFDGKTISLDPSIGNWGFECKSHYWIRGSRVRWAARWSQGEIDYGRARDRWAKEKYFSDIDSATDDLGRDKPESVKAERGFWNGIRRKIRRWWQ